VQKAFKSSYAFMSPGPARNIQQGSAGAENAMTSGNSMNLYLSV